MSEYVVLVDENDQSIGTMEKLEAHVKGLLHRAFSIFIFNSNDELLLQRRALAKYHTPGLWTNTCCSHQRENESTIDAANRRLLEEMGMTCDLVQVSSFMYKVSFENGLTENEYDHIVFGRSNDLPEINPLEVEEYKYISLPNLKEDIAQNPDHYTYWFKLAISKINFDVLLA